MTCPDIMRSIDKHDPESWVASESWHASCRKACTLLAASVSGGRRALIVALHGPTQEFWFHHPEALEQKLYSSLL